MGTRSEWQFWASEKNKKNRQSENWPLYKPRKKNPLKFFALLRAKRRPLHPAEEVTLAGMLTA
jgi:hypothetical protein